MTRSLQSARRLVVKIGSALLVDPANLTVRRDWLAALGEDVAAARERGQEVVLVTSGAIAAGRVRLGLAGRPLRLEEQQAAAAVGQIHLAQLYQEILGAHGLIVAQILLTREDTEARRRHLNARATIDQLLALCAVPVINENDTVTTAEIRFGDNDRLAARVAGMISADTLVLLSDIDGLYTADPRVDPAARHLPEIGDLTPEILAMAGPPAPGMSSGGMITKLAAARIALAAGCRMVIAQGKQHHPLRRIEAGARCSWFIPSAEPLTARKRWIAGSVAPSGAVIIDDGAAAALGAGRSLLPAGVVAVVGVFERGDAILVQCRDGAVVARGLSAYASADIERISGHKSSEIESLLGYRGRDEIIHRDDLVVG
jgi:glutamate 5-kinase